MKYEISITKTTQPKERLADESKLGFGKIFTDHMFIMDYSDDSGWHDARIVPFGPIALHPASTVLHYGAEIFEGMKAYRTANGEISMFRPLENIRRLNQSAERLCLPTIDEEACLDILKTLVALEKDWVPHADGTSLYIRPYIYGNDPHLGVHAVHNATFVVICSPVGAYYAEGIKPVKIAIESEDVRAVRGGTGYAKCGGNYAASLRAGKRAEERGYTQVLWLDGVERKYIEEVGAMNVMFKINGKIVTPTLTGSVLPGITRKSCVELLREWGYEVEERLISVDELFDAAEKGTLEEAWGTGTAAVVSPIGHLSYKDQIYTVSNNEIGALTQKLYDELTGIQWGKSEDKHNWVEPVCKA
ncbi:MAG: branched-chain amino acid aminotransferase [Clostridia bacterium]|nr:branched-chain amino acid aminotransferase [Clostridia bacterium]